MRKGKVYSIVSKFRILVCSPALFSSSRAAQDWVCSFVCFVLVFLAKNNLLNMQRSSSRSLTGSVDQSVVGSNQIDRPIDRSIDREVNHSFYIRSEKSGMCEIQSGGKTSPHAGDTTSHKTET